MERCKSAGIGLILLATLLVVSARVYVGVPQSLLSAYHKTFSVMRGEPLVVMFKLLLIDHLWSLIERQPTWHDGLNALAYMGLVNAVSFLPTLVFATRFIFRITQAVRALVSGSTVQGLRDSLLFLCIVGFVWFLLCYPGSEGDTVKAIHLMAIFPLLYLLVGQVLARVEQRSPRLFRGLLLVSIFNFPILFTRVN